MVSGLFLQEVAGRSYQNLKGAIFTFLARGTCRWHDKPAEKRMTNAPIILTSQQLQVTILPFGASLVGVRFANHARNMVLGFANPQNHRSVHPFAGPLVGPIANRIAGGRVDIAGQTYQMQRNEQGRTTLHSGDLGLHNRLWTVASKGPDHVTLTCALTHGENALPGNRIITASYRIEGTALILTLNATTDRPTAINIAPHAYWNLDGAPDVGQHQLHINANTYLPVDDHMIPIGQVYPVAGTAFDFTNSAPVPLAPWLDVNYCLSNEPRRSLTRAAVLRGADGTTLTLSTTAAGLQVYNGAFLPDDTAQMADCPPIAPYSAIALEPQGWPDAPNQPGFPSIMIDTDTPFHQQTVFHLAQNIE